MVHKSTMFQNGGGGGVTTINGESGAVTLTSSGATISITTPTASTINLESVGGGSAPGGVQYDVQLNDGSGGFAGSNNLNFQGGYLTIAGDSGYGQLQWVSLLNGGYGGAGINGTSGQIIPGSAAGDLSIWASQSINFGGNTGNAIQLSIDGATGKINIPELTASQLTATDASSNLQSLTTATYPSLTEISYVKGATSAIQTQLNGKQPSGSYLTAVTSNAPLSGSGTSGSHLVISQATTSTDGYLSSTDWNTFNSKGAGTVTAVSIASTNGFAGSSSGGATPTLTISTSVTGITKGNGTALSAALAGTDYTTPTGTEGLSNKRITRRVLTTNAPGATPSTNTNNVDIQEFTGLATAITSMTTNLTGTPTNGQMVQFSFIDDGTARAITWGASFANGGLVNLPTTTVISTVLRVLVQYQTIASLNKFVCIAVA